jgi:hypothetical protein
MLISGCDRPSGSPSDGPLRQSADVSAAATDPDQSLDENSPIADEVLVSDPPVALTGLSTMQQTEVLSLLKEQRDNEQIGLAKVRAAEIRRINRVVVQVCQDTGGQEFDSWVANYKRGYGLPPVASLEANRRLNLVDTSNLPTWVVEEALNYFDPSSATSVELNRQELDNFRRYKALCEELFLKLDGARAKLWTTEFNDTFRIPEEVAKRMEREIFKLENDFQRGKDEPIPELILLYHRIGQVAAQ